MKILDWLFGRVPTEHDPAPNFPKNFAIQVSLNEPTEPVAAIKNGRSYTLEPYFTMIEYTDATGVSTRRRITMRKINVTGGVGMLLAFCHERNAMRSFRLDRVSCLIDQDGAIETAADWFREIMAISESVDFAHSQRKTEPCFTVSPYTALNRVVSPAIIVLAAAARSDNFLHPAEIREILLYLEDEAIALRDAGRLGGNLDAAMFEKFERLIRRLRPTKVDVSDSISKIAVWDRLQTGRFASALAKSVKADGKIDAGEAEILADLTASAFSLHGYGWDADIHATPPATS